MTGNTSEPLIGWNIDHLITSSHNYKISRLNPSQDSLLKSTPVLALDFPLPSSETWQVPQILKLIITAFMEHLWVFIRQ